MREIFQEVFDVLVHIGEDMIEPVGYLPLGAAAGAVYLIVYGIWKRVTGRRDGDEKEKGGHLKRKWLWTLCVVYTTVILYLAFFSREPGSRNGIDLMLFETWKASSQAKAYVIENVLMFIPFGILLPAGFAWFRSGLRCTGAGMAASILLELAQLITQRGHCQLDDVVMNTLGAWIGWTMFRYVIRRRSRRD